MDICLHTAAHWFIFRAIVQWDCLSLSLCDEAPKAEE